MCIDSILKFTKIALGVATIVSSFTLMVGCGQSSSKPADRESRANLLSVEALVVQPQLLRNQIFTTGTLLANEEVELRPEISGRIIGVYFDEGRSISKGELMLKINDRELLAQQKRKELEEKQAADEEHRKRQLFEINVISQEEYDKSLNALKLIQAEKEVIESQLAKTEIRAPFDGVVGLRYVSEGGYVSPNMLAATMQDLDPMKVEFSVPEKYSQELKNGIEIMVRVGESEEVSKGVVYAVESKIDPGTRTIKTRAMIPNPTQALMPGSFAKVEITLHELRGCHCHPDERIDSRNQRRKSLCLRERQSTIGTGQDRHPDGKKHPNHQWSFCFRYTDCYRSASTCRRQGSENSILSGELTGVFE